MIMKLLSKIAGVIAVVALTFAVVACNKNPKPSSKADLTAINATIAKCEQVLAAATPALYPEDAIDEFKVIIAEIKPTLNDLTQTQVDALNVQLLAQLAAFESLKYEYIPASAVTMSLSFDEGTGTSLKTKGSNTWTATLCAGPSEIFGSDTAIPTFVTGKVGKAIHFEKGSHIEIADYAANKLEVGAMSISVWVNPDKVFSGNYIVSYNYWNSFKLQVQDASKPFFTLKAGENCQDMDNETDQSVPAKTWSHVVVTWDGAKGEVYFYVNGEVTKVWDPDSKAGTLKGNIASYANKLPLLIGACTTYAEACSWSWADPSQWAKNPESWDCFYGSIDEVAIYNTVLTPGQVKKLYNTQK